MRHGGSPAGEADAGGGQFVAPVGVDMAPQEVSGQCEARGYGAGGGRRRRIEQERRQRQQPVLPRRTRRLRHGAAGTRRDVGEAARCAADRATAEVEAVAQLGQQLHLPAHIPLRPLRIGLYCIQQSRHRFEQPRYRLTLGQRAVDHGAGGGDARQAQPIRQNRRRHRLLQLAVERAQLVLDSGSPPGGDPVARLQHRLRPPAGATVDQTGMPALLPGQNGKQSRRLGVLTRRQNDRPVCPLHIGSTFPRSTRARPCPVPARFVSVLINV